MRLKHGSGFMFAAAQLAAADVKSHVVGVGRQERLRMSELQAIASDPDVDHVHLVTDFASLQFVTASIAKTLCQGATECCVNL